MTQNLSLTLIHFRRIEHFRGFDFQTYTMFQNHLLLINQYGFTDDE